MQAEDNPEENTATQPPETDSVGTSGQRMFRKLKPYPQPPPSDFPGYGEAIDLCG